MVHNLVTSKNYKLYIHRSLYNVIHRAGEEESEDKKSWRELNKYTHTTMCGYAHTTWSQFERATYTDVEGSEEILWHRFLGRLTAHLLGVVREWDRLTQASVHSNCVLINSRWERLQRWCSSC